MDPRTLARECAVQILFQMELGRQAPEEAFALYWPSRDVPPDVRDMAERLARGTALDREDIDALIRSALEHWRLERMPVVDRNILRLAIFEFLHEATTPPIVVIDEAIDLAKKYGGEDSGHFVNGVLDALRKRIEEGALR
jgi:N utilization substance protein B